MDKHINKQWCLYSALNNMIFPCFISENVKEKIQDLITIQDIHTMTKKEMEVALIDIFTTNANLH